MHDTNDVILNRRSDQHVTQQLLHLTNQFPAIVREDFSRIPDLRASRPLKDLSQLYRRRRCNHELEEKSIQLRLGKRISSLKLDGILGGQNYERGRQGMGFAEDRHLLLFHRLQYRRLGLWRRTVDLIREDHMSKYRALFKLKLATATCFSQNFSADDVRGHQIRRELNALE